MACAEFLLNDVGSMSGKGISVPEWSGDLCGFIVLPWLGLS